jgi:hypothetical protein
MPIEFLTRQITFTPTTGPTTFVVETWDFETSVRQVTAVLNGFQVDFVEAEKHFHLMQIDVAARQPTGPLGQHVEVEVFLRLGDFTGNFDDPYEGYVRITLIVER